MDLRANQRYLFYYKQPNNSEHPMFRANFIKLVVHENSRHLLVNCYHSSKYQHEDARTVWSIDTNLISNVETLPDILGNNCVLPDDVLLEIDNYF